MRGTGLYEPASPILLLAFVSPFKDLFWPMLDGMVNCDGFVVVWMETVGVLKKIAVLFELAVAKSGFQMFCFVCRGLKYTHFRVIQVED